MSEIVWHKHGSNLANRISDDGRWLIWHPRNNITKQWVLYDQHSETRWCGDWPTLTSAKTAAERRARGWTGV